MTEREPGTGGTMNDTKAVLVHGPEACGGGDPIPGVAAPMNSDYGIQRCDVCALYPDDESAAQAPVDVLVPGGVVQRLHFEPFDFGIYVDGRPVDLERLLRERES